MRRPSRPEAVRTVQKVLFVDRLQSHDNRPLEHFILQGRNSQGPGFRSRPFRNTHPPYWRSPVRSGLGVITKRLKVLQEILLVVVRGLPVHARGAILARLLKSLGQPNEAKMV